MMAGRPLEPGARANKGLRREKVGRMRGLADITDPPPSWSWGKKEIGSMIDKREPFSWKSE